MNLSSPISALARVGPILQKRLKKLGIRSVRDLLYHIPSRYEDFSKVIPIATAILGQACSFEGMIESIGNERSWRKRMTITEAIVSDSSGAIRVVWFNQIYLSTILKAGDTILLSGKISENKGGKYMANPMYEKMNSEESTTGFWKAGGLVGVYPETEGLSSRWLRSIIRSTLKALGGEITEALPQEILQRHHLLELKRALQEVHFPTTKELARKAKERFAFEDLFLIELFVLRERAKLSREKAFAIAPDIPLLKRFTDSLPFRLTDAQKKAAWHILKDIEKPRPMNRLLEGDVGSGKTVVAALAILNLIKQGYQAAFMAPTEILAKQHFHTIFNLIKGFNVNIGLITGKEDKFYSKKLKNDVIEISRRKLLEKILKNEISLLIGTHALIQQEVRFDKLALVVIDEQHRFGVEQRARLCSPASANATEKIIPHLLSMTATPIPRTLALTLYGDLDVSVLDELPKGRKRIITEVVLPSKRQEKYDFVRKEALKGKQVFIICPRIEPQERTLKDIAKVEVKTVKEEYDRLSREIFPDLAVSMIHGKMSPREKEKTMSNFKRGKVNILVSTSVVEVGVDIPNATVMIIEGAERFGLAQLHQFRGRVGRSTFQSYCFLFAQSASAKTAERLKALVEADTGFKLAEKDLELRGPGELTGNRQWGLPDRTMDFLKDMVFVETVREAAKETLRSSPHLKKYPLLEERMGHVRSDVHFE